MFDVVYVTFPNERFKKANKERRKVRRQKRSTITIEANKKHIKNLSNKELTNDQINLLAKGLKFIPTPVTKQTQIRQQLLRDRDRIEHFIEQANNHHPTVKFTTELSDKETTFLDTYIYKGERFERDAILDVRTHFKPTETFQYTHFASCHPQGLKKGFIKGEAL